MMVALLPKITLMFIKLIGIHHLKILKITTKIIVETRPFPSIIGLRQSMFNGIVMNVIKMPLQILLISDGMFPIFILPNLVDIF